MSGWIVAHEAVLRGSAFATVFMIVAIAETIVEARPLRVSRRVRWTHNLTLTLLDTIVLRLLFPLGATAAAIWSDGRGIGLLRLVAWPPLLNVAIAIALLDLTVYGQHVLFHAVPLLFRFHQVHHADVDFDVTLGTRFHPTYRERSSVDPRLVGMPDHQFDIRQSVRWMLMLPFRPTRRRPPIRIHTQQEAA